MASLPFRYFISLPLALLRAYVLSLGALVLLGMPWGMDLRCDGGNGDMELFNGVDASLCTHLSSYPLIVLGNSSGSSLE